MSSDVYVNELRARIDRLEQGLKDALLYRPMPGVREHEPLLNRLRALVGQEAQHMPMDLHPHGENGPDA